MQRRLDDDAPKPLLGLHVVVDAGNGSGGFYADFLESLGAWVEGSQFLKPDGAFPNHAPNPESPEAMRALSKAVVKNEADLGVMFDADCDRAAIVLSDGRFVNKNRLIALTAAMLLSKTPGLTNRHRFRNQHRPYALYFRMGRHALPLQARLPLGHRRGHSPQRRGH